jgi:hypothetical protein
VALAWQEACSKEVSPTYLRDIYDVFRAEASTKAGAEAQAFAKAIATARTTCKADGNAYGCAAAFAHSAAWATAAAEAHAQAWALAIQQCPCDDKMQSMQADADAHADETALLTARVEAVASAEICSQPNGIKRTHAQAQTCLQDIYALVYAKV